MFRHRLVSPDQPPAIRLLFGLIEFLASAALATIVIAFGAVVLAWATWVESRLGTPAARFGIYESNWFAGLLAVLGVNVAAAALVRYPWRREQIGFLIVHAGILVLLIGCWFSREYGINGGMALFEGGRSSEIQLDEQQFELTVARSTADDARKTIVIPFRPGPFNWSDYDSLPRFPWRWVGRDRGVLYDRDGIKLEVLDYCVDSRRVPVPRVRLRVEEAGRPDSETYQELTLASRRRAMPDMGHRTLYEGMRERLAAGPVVTFRAAESEEETNAFRESRPKKPLGRLGQIVLYARGKTHWFSVESLQGEGPVALGNTGLRIELSRFDPFGPRVLLNVYADDDVKPTGILALDAVEVDRDFQGSRCGVIGSYWFAPPDEESASTSETPDEPTEPDDASSAETEATPPTAGLRKTEIPESAAREAAAPRIDLIQGHDRKLYYRTWNDGRIEASGELFAEAKTDKPSMPPNSNTSPKRKRGKTPATNPKRKRGETSETNPKRKREEIGTPDKDGQAVHATPSEDGDGVTVFPGTRFASVLSVVEFIAADEPGYDIVPIEFDRDRQSDRPRVQVRLTVDGETRTLWLSDEFAADPDERFAAMRGKDRFLGLRLANRWMDLGFQVELREFECRFDPGTSQPSHYGSYVDFLTKDKDPRVLKENVFLSPNRPADVVEPTTGRVFRFFQNAPRRPYVFQPGQPEFDRHVGGRRKTDRLYRSTFMVAHDPGRLLKYAGCFMIIGGIVVLYYMRAYLFRRRDACKPERP